MQRNRFITAAKYHGHRRRSVSWFTYGKKNLPFLRVQATPGCLADAGL